MKLSHKTDFPSHPMLLLWGTHSFRRQGRRHLSQQMVSWPGLAEPVIPCDFKNNMSVRPSRWCRLYWWPFDNSTSSRSTSTSLSWPRPIFDVFERDPPLLMCIKNCCPIFYIGSSPLWLSSHFWHPPPSSNCLPSNSLYMENSQHDCNVLQSGTWKIEVPSCEPVRLLELFLFLPLIFILCPFLRDWLMWPLFIAFSAIISSQLRLLPIITTSLMVLLSASTSLSSSRWGNNTMWPFSSSH